MKFIQVCILSFMQASLMLSRPSQADDQFSFGKVTTPSSTSSPAPPTTAFLNVSSAETTLASENETSQSPSTKFSIFPIEESQPLGGENKEDGNISKRDVRDQLFPLPSTVSPSIITPAKLPFVTDRPQTTTLGFPFGGSFSRHRRDFPTQKPSLPASTLRPADFFVHGQTPTVKSGLPSTTATAAELPNLFNRHRRESPTIPPFIRPQPTTASSTPGNRDSRLFFSFTTRNSGDSIPTTRRSFFNRNRRTPLLVTVGLVTSSTRGSFLSQNDAPKSTTANSPSTEKLPLFGTSSTLDPLKVEQVVTSTDEPTSTTLKSNFGRFRRSSHEFLPEEEEEQFGQGHIHVTTARLPPSTKKSFPSRVRRSSDDDGNHAPHAFHIGHFDGDEPLETSSVPSTTLDQSKHETAESSSTTQRHFLGGEGRFRRSDLLDLGSASPFNRRTTSTQQPSTSSTKEQISTTRQPISHFH